MVTSDPENSGSLSRDAAACFALRIGTIVPITGRMSRFSPPLPALLLAGLSLPLTGSADWTCMREGITLEETTEALGQPLIRTYGRGFEVWIYDGRGEVIFAGGDRALGWSVPVPNPESAARPVERDVLLKPVVRLPALRRTSGTTTALPSETEVRFRYLRQR